MLAGRLHWLAHWRSLEGRKVNLSVFERYERNTSWNLADCLMENLTKRKFGKLTVVRFAGKTCSGDSKWLCECSCISKNQVVVVRSDLIRHHTESCGCIKLKHGQNRRGRPSRIYTLWCAMIQRCHNPNCKDFRDYGGRVPTITVCGRWRHNFENFFADMGPCPPGMTLGRKNNNGSYDPDNCEWQTPESQANNKRNNRFITFNGKIQTCSQWGRELSLSRGTIRSRMVMGWPVEDILSIQRYPKTRHSKTP